MVQGGDDEQACRNSMPSNYRRVFYYQFVQSTIQNVYSVSVQPRIGEFERNYNQTKSIVVHRMSNMTSNSRDQMVCIDVPGTHFKRMEKYENTNGAIIMADRTSRVTIKNVTYYYNKLRKDYPDIPIVICLNKMDIRDTSKDHNNNFRYGVSSTDTKVQFCKISAKSNLNFDVRGSCGTTRLRTEDTRAGIFHSISSPRLVYTMVYAHTYPVR